jgi:indole-3-glycerol phosphate synthase
MSDILEKILSVKREEIAVLKQLRSEEDLLAEATARRDVRGFANALRECIQTQQNAVIADSQGL